MIGVFDSGIGGLTVFKEFITELPRYDYMYLGDNARAPYGNKSQTTIYNYTRAAVDFLCKQGCELIILACNTASAKALPKIQQEWLPNHYPNRRVLGVVIPAVEATIEQIRQASIKDNKKRIGIIGTQATIDSQVYEDEFAKRLKNNINNQINNLSLQICGQKCGLLVPLIEEGWSKKPITKIVLKKYLRPLKQKKVQYLILGCTHYPVLLKEIEKIMGKNVKIISSAEATGKKLIDYLKRHAEIEVKIRKNRQRIFYTTDEPQHFQTLGKKLLGMSFGQVKKIELL